MQGEVEKICERYGTSRDGIHIRDTKHHFNVKRAFHVSMSAENLQHTNPVASEVTRVLLDDAVTPRLRCVFRAFANVINNDAKVILCFHAMKGEERVEEIMRGNFATMSNMDPGFFGEFVYPGPTLC